MGFAHITLQLVAFRLLALLVVAAVQGLVLAGTAVVLGDKGPKYDGRLTPNPGAHFDMIGAAGVILFGLGWTKPMAIDPAEMRSGNGGLVLVVLAGFVGLVLTAAALDALVRPALTMLPHTAGLTTAAFLRLASSLSLWFAIFNLLPIPPLTGGLLLQAAGVRVPSQAQWLGVVVLLVALASGVVRQILEPAYTFLATLVFGG